MALLPARNVVMLRLSPASSTKINALRNRHKAGLDHCNFQFFRYIAADDQNRSLVREKLAEIAAAQSPISFCLSNAHRSSNARSGIQKVVLRGERSEDTFKSLARTMWEAMADVRILKAGFDGKEAVSFLVKDHTFRYHGKKTGIFCRAPSIAVKTFTKGDQESSRLLDWLSREYPNGFGDVEVDGFCLGNMKDSRSQEPTEPLPLEEFPFLGQSQVSSPTEA
ncbi:uncharacterized protein L3040_008753 [Drepanopeziza brunnea f. sp. 'multigermtubi']|uniref:Uncharacterized protein n=1 Tax=Marssonina brunnea f. sp. multigermtubi (strain MB_m1) TaxID=1072389 RepID=K1XD56_MARBU|nr:uncharacterized protein MBM_02985 [Drepanopeziza brunnea f. sp. 'multigermtubi' MB_m1]EKD18743.1 hypothetical protein MBM_02985 [Drepanopeziza brunnea f. sp. 'multigermtubi' MB_m1]KAJ5033641.1 hypothetical protein L3040_008753 [Drepanopeziza brunnea f. sp. 'multigermtubi']